MSASSYTDVEVAARYRDPGGSVFERVCESFDRTANPWVCGECEADNHSFPEHVVLEGEDRCAECDEPCDMRLEVEAAIRGVFEQDEAAEPVAVREFRRACKHRLRRTSELEGYQAKLGELVPEVLLCGVCGAFLEALV